MGLGARLAAAFAGLALVTTLLVGGASYVTTDRQVVGEVDDFLEDRADELVDGSRQQPRDRRDRGRGDDDPIAVDADAEVQILDEGGAITSNTGLTLPVSTSDVALADKDGSPRLRTETIDGVDHRIITQHVPGGGAVQVARSLGSTVLEHSAWKMENTEGRRRCEQSMTR